MTTPSSGTQQFTFAPARPSRPVQGWVVVLLGAITCLLLLGATAAGAIAYRAHVDIDRAHASLRPFDGSEILHLRAGERMAVYVPDDETVGECDVQALGDASLGDESSGFQVSFTRDGREWSSDCDVAAETGGDFELVVTGGSGDLMLGTEVSDASWRDLCLGALVACVCVAVAVCFAIATLTVGVIVVATRRRV